jgi:FkbM family methyltransferase
MKLAAVIALILFACSCGPSEEPPKQQAAPEKFGSAIERIHAKHRRAKGRVGILAEEKLYSTFDEELIIRDFFQDRRGGFFLDVGCAGPVKASNTYYLEKHLGWSGIGVDALEEYALEWGKLRPNSRFLTYLVGDESDTSEKFFRSFGVGISSADEEWARGKVHGVEWPTEELQVATITLDDLLDREGVTSIDLLSMDIEGHEPKALAGFDIERFQPELVVIEGQVDPQKQAQVANYFERHGYERIQRYRPFDTVNDYYRRKERP